MKKNLLMISAITAGLLFMPTLRAALIPTAPDTTPLGARETSFISSGHDDYTARQDLLILAPVSKMKSSNCVLAVGKKMYGVVGTTGSLSQFDRNGDGMLSSYDLSKAGIRLARWSNTSNRLLIMSPGKAGVKDISLTSDTATFAPSPGVTKSIRLVDYCPFDRSIVEPQGM